MSNPKKRCEECGEEKTDVRRGCFRPDCRELCFSCKCAGKVGHTCGAGRLVFGGDDQ